MNSAPQVQTAELTDAELDNVAGGLAGGLAPHGSLTVGSTTVSDADVLAQVDAVKGQALSTLGQAPHVSGSFSV